MITNHFANDSLLLARVERKSVDGALACLDTFCSASGSMVSGHKTNFWLVGLDAPSKVDQCSLYLHVPQGGCPLFRYSLWSCFVSSSFVGLVSSDSKLRV